MEVLNRKHALGQTALADLASGDLVVTGDGVFEVCALLGVHIDDDGDALFTFLLYDMQEEQHIVDNWWESDGNLTVLVLAN